MKHQSLFPLLPQSEEQQEGNLALGHLQKVRWINWSPWWVSVWKNVTFFKLNQKTDPKKQPDTQDFTSMIMRLSSSKLSSQTKEIISQTWVFKHHKWGHSSVLALGHYSLIPVYSCTSLLFSRSPFRHVLFVNVAAELMSHPNVSYDTHKAFFKYNAIKLQTNESLQEAPGCLTEVYILALIWPNKEKVARG